MNASEITTLFLPPMDCLKNLILSEDAAMWTVPDVAEFLDPLPAFTYRQNDGYL